MTEVGRKNRLGQAGHDVIEEGLLRLRLDRVELAEGETEEAVAVGVLHKRLAQGRGELDGLLGDGGTSHVHGVRADVSARSTAVTIADAPGGASDQAEGRGLRRVVCGVALSLRRR